MKRTTKWQFLLWLFISLCFINLWAEFVDYSLVIFFTKPLLVTLLAIYFFINTSPSRSNFSWFIFFGLCFSVLGDTILMFSENLPQSQHFFVWGLSSFLITHLCYLLAFIRIQPLNKGWLKKNLWAVFCGLGLLLGNIGFLWKDIPGDLQIPVFIYSAVIIVMALSCINLKESIPDSVFNRLLVGVLLFVLSDNIIALHKFKSDDIRLFHPRILIMSTYLLSQLLITTNSLNFSSISQSPNRINQAKRKQNSTDYTSYSK